jgi:hypothetical protein
MSEEESPKENLPVEKSIKSGTVSIIVLLLSIVAFAVALVFVIQKGASIQQGEVTTEESPKSNFSQGKEFMVYLRKVEVKPMKANGKAWDLRGSAPDIYYTLTWKNNKIYESDVKKDSLITEWIPIGIDLKESLLKGAVSIDQALQLPIVKWTGDDLSDKLIFEVYDNDLDADDLIQNMTLYLSGLKPGKNVKDFSDTPEFGLERAEIYLIDNSLSQSDKIQALMGGQ